MVSVTNSSMPHEVVQKTTLACLHITHPESIVFVITN